MSLSKSRTAVILTLAWVVALAFGGVVSVGAQDDGNQDPIEIDAHAVLRNQAGDQVGTVRFVEEANIGTVAVLLSVTGLQPGFSDWGLYSVGTCDTNTDPVFGSVGERFDLDDDMADDTDATNTAFRTGDMPPLLVMSNGNAAMSFRTDGFVLTDLMDGDGTSVVIHSGVGSYWGVEGDMAAEAGAQAGAADAGQRVVCGVIEQGDAPLDDDMTDDDMTGDDAADDTTDANMTDDDEPIVVEGDAADADEGDTDTGADDAIGGEMQELVVTLTEFNIAVPATIPAGPVAFLVTNQGQQPHNLRIEGNGIDQSFETDLQPGQSDRLELTLEPGTYRFYSPTGDDANQGMDVEIEVVE